jgi:hypothetical protein
MRLRLVAAFVAFALVPVAAGAQGTVITTTGGAVGAAVIGRSPGISVQGTAVAEAIVHTVRVAVIAHNFDMSDDDFLVAMRNAGVVDGNYLSTLSTLFGQGANGMRNFRGLIHDATPERLSALERAAKAFPATHAGAVVDAVQFYGDVADCPALEANARVAAVSDAKRRAQALATLTGVAVGPATNISESGGCGSFSAFAGFPGNFFPNNAFPIDPQTLMMRVNMTESMTFALVKKT